MSGVSEDQRYMRRALTLARQGLGRTSPNPMVGCVVVKASKVVGEGCHRFCGGDHAELEALKKAGIKARGSTLYVTLEPCGHWGRTPPCVEAIIQAGVRRVVVAMVDPNPVNNGRSLRKLKSRGVMVLKGVCEAKARELNAAFIKHVSTGMPFVVAKSAQTLDGKIATASGDSKWITSEATRARARKERNAFDVILVGVGTVLADDPGLSAPNKWIRKVVLDPSLKTPPGAKLFKGAHPGQVVVVCRSSVSRAKVRRIEDKGARVVPCPVKKDGLDLKWLFRQLAREDVMSVLIEGGARTVGRAIKAGLVDRYRVHLAPRLLGDPKGRSSVDLGRVAKISGARVLKLLSVEKCGEDIVVEGAF